MFWKVGINLYKGDNVSSKFLIAMSYPSNQTNTISLFIDAQTFRNPIATALEEVAKLIDRIVGLDF